SNAVLLERGSDYQSIRDTQYFSKIGYVYAAADGNRRRAGSRFRDLQFLENRLGARGGTCHDHRVSTTTTDQLFHFDAEIAGSERSRMFHIDVCEDFHVKTQSFTVAQRVLRGALNYALIGEARARMNVHTDERRSGSRSNRKRT